VEHNNFTDKDFKNRAIDNLKLAKKLFDEMKVSFFLSNGTLLGWARERDLISHDYDIDVGVFTSDLSEQKNIRDKFYDNGFVSFKEDDEVFQSAIIDHGLSLIRNDVKLDIFFYRNEDNVSIMTVWGTLDFLDYVYPRIYSYITIDFLDDTFQVPANYLNYIIAQYGQDWRTPVIEWDYQTSPQNTRHAKV
jgi:phosphorylcholine metabolism protein LicD